MKLKLVITLPFLFIFVACGGGKKLTSAQQRPTPEWVNARPIDHSFYIGIGSANKRTEPLSFAETARKNALSALTSEIRVNVRSESFLNTMQVNSQVQEAYNQTIATTSNEDIEGFEIVDVYETSTDYFVFYRLSKSRHDAIRRERKMSILQGAFDQLVQARDARDRANIIISSDTYLRGLFDMKEYWNEPNPWSDNGSEIFLDNTLFREFREMVSDIELSADIERVVLNAGNRFREEVRVRASYNGIPVRGLKVSYTYDDGRIRNLQAGETDINGELRIPIERVNMSNRSNNLNVRVQVEQFRPADLDRRLVNPMTENLRTSPLILPIVAEMPIVHLAAIERNLGQVLGTERLAAPLRTRLDERGFRFTNVTKQADYIIEISGMTREGGTSQGFHVAYLDMQITVRDLEGKILFQRSESNIKGLQLNYEAAGLESYKTGARRIERELADALIDALF